jgi:hypothetical protein
MPEFIVLFIGLIIFSPLNYSIVMKKHKYLNKGQLKFLISTSIMSFIIVGVILTVVIVHADSTNMKIIFSIFLMGLIAITYFFVRLYIKNYLEGKKYEIYLKEIRLKIQNEELITIKEFYDSYNKNINIYGVYILYNKTKNKYYVGKSQNIVSRVKNHIEGRGNAHLFADLKYGDEFMISLVSYDSQKFTSLNQQERFYISVFDAFENGYNRTRGG